MLLNSILFCLLFLCTCKPQSIKIDNDFRTVDEYIITFKNSIPEDTVLKRRSFYNSNGNLIKEISYYRGQILQTIIYLNKDTVNLKDYLSKSDSIIYSTKSRGKETQLYNGRWIDEIFYDENNNIIKQISYNSNSDRRVPVTEEFIYLYDRSRKRSSEIFLWNKDTLYEIRYTYTKDFLLLEKYYLRNKCCERNQPIPADKIIYEYDHNRNMIKEIEVVNRNIKRDYKDRFNGYYNKASITTYSYDNQSRLIDKKIYTPNFSEDSNAKINELYTIPSSLSEEYIYKYN